MPFTSTSLKSSLHASVPERVCAVVVTFKRQELLKGCLSALLSQTRPLDGILVVDNASNDGTVEMVREQFPSVEVLELDENSGGAGGFHAGMKHAFGQGYDWLWLMDDDGRAASDCLEQLLGASDRPGARVPMQRDESGRFYGVGQWPHFETDITPRILAHAQPIEGKFLFAFVGPLIHREVVEKIGLPIKEFFIWFDDVEYALRIQTKAKMPVVVVPGAVFHHNFGSVKKEARFLWRRSMRGFFAPWKLYYGTRNPIYIILHQRKSRSELYRFLALQAKHLAGELIFNPEDRWERARQRFRGLRDGLRGELGRRH